MVLQEIDVWEQFVESLNFLRVTINRSRAVNINSSTLRSQARQAAQVFFRNIRPELRKFLITAELLVALDQDMQRLFHLSLGQNAKTSYQGILNNLKPILNSIAIDRELSFSNEASLAEAPGTVTLSKHEKLIYDSIEKLVPSAARSYRQAILDLSEDTRTSYRGAANELREALREVLDFLAPDNEVAASQGFQFEDKQTTPSRKQKAYFVLKARRMSKKAIRAPQELIELIETQVAIVISAAFGRTNVASHIQTERIEVQRVKQYTDIILSELLSLPPP